MGKKSTRADKVVIGLSTNEVRVLLRQGDKYITNCKTCNSPMDWNAITKKMIDELKVSNKIEADVVLGTGLYNTVQLPKNDSLTEEELRGIAVYKDLEPATQGRVMDYTWDFYDTKTSKNSKPSLTFVLIEKRIIKQISEFLADLVSLRSITINDLVMAEFISYCQSLSLNRDSNDRNYPNQVCICLFFPKGKELMVYAVHQGEVCYSRVLRGYKELSQGLISGPNDPVISKITTEILRLSDDFLTAQLGLPPLSKLLVIIDSDQLASITEALSMNFRRIVEVVPIKNYIPDGETVPYGICKDPNVCELADNDLGYLSLFGALIEGTFTNA